MNSLFLLRNSPNDNLSPCPFCGSNDLYVYCGTDAHVVCRSCGTHGPVIKAKMFAENIDRLNAIAQWNKRSNTLDK